MLDVHSEALDSGSGPYHEFLLGYKTSRPIVYGFVEGREDPSFYRGFIDGALPPGWVVQLIRSGNKKTVLDVLAGMPWDRFSRGRVCFFVDRDLSEYLEPNAVVSDSLYVTDNYSIENDVVTAHVFERVVEEVFNVTNLNDTERECIRNLFEGNMSCFCDALAPVMAQILVWRRVGARAFLDNIKPGAMFCFAGGQLGVLNHYQSTMSKIGYAASCVKLPVSSSDELTVAEAEFRSRAGVQRFVRGKYLLWFFVEAASALHAAISTFCPRHPRPPKVHLTLGTANAMAVAAPRAKIPQSLREFIARNYIEYIQRSGIAA